MKKKTRAYKEGHSAGMQGLKKESCRYIEGSTRFADWHLGYCHGGIKQIKGVHNV